MSKELEKVSFLLLIVIAQANKRHFVWKPGRDQKEQYISSN